MTAATLVEEPQSGISVPLFLDAPDCSWRLLGTALRKKRVVVDVQVYVVGVYGGPALVDSLLKAQDAFSDRTDPESFDTLGFLLSSREDKVFVLTFLRTVSGHQVVSALTDALCSIAEVAREEVDILAPIFPASVPGAAEVRITARATSGTVLVKCSWNEETECLQSSELCRGLQECFLGPKALVLGLAESSRHLLRDLAFSQSDLQSSQSNLQSGCDETTPTFGQSMAVTPESRSWKERSGRVAGKDGYEFGDLSRALAQKMKSAPRAELPWSSPLVLEEGATWVTAADVTLLTDGLSDRVLESKFLKHHSSLIRGRLAPEWSERVYQLQGGLISYRRRSGGRLVDQFCVDGCHVVAEAPKISHPNQSGEFLVFRIHRGSELLCRLSSCDRKLMVEWVSAIAGACAYFHAQSSPVTTPSCISQTPNLTSSEAPNSPQSAAVLVKPTPSQTMSGWKAGLAASRHHVNSSINWLLLQRSTLDQTRKGTLLLLLAALFTLFVASRNRRRRLLPSSP